MARASEIGKGIGFWIVTALFLLLPGIGLVVAGVSVDIAGDTAQEIQRENEGDDDGDGRIDEDTYGDADNSANDPTKVSGSAELSNPYDDDADGRTDEDPAPRGDLQAGLAGVSRVGTSLWIFGAILILAYVLVVVVRTTRQHRLKIAAAQSMAPPMVTPAPPPPPMERPYPPR